MSCTILSIDGAKIFGFLFFNFVKPCDHVSLILNLLDCFELFLGFGMLLEISCISISHFEP